MQKLVIFITIFISAVETQSQNAKVSTMTLVEEDDHWNIQIQSSLDAFRKEVKEHFSETPYQTQDQFEQQLFEHLNNTLKIKVNNGQYVKLGHGAIKLGHETAVLFDQIKLPEDIATIKITCGVFKDILGSKMNLIIIRNLYEEESYLLDINNNYTLTFMTEHSRFVLQKKNKAHSLLYWSILIPALSMIALMTGTYLLKTKKLNTSSIRSFFRSLDD